MECNIDNDYKIHGRRGNDFLIYVASYTKRSKNNFSFYLKQMVSLQITKLNTLKK